MLLQVHSKGNENSQAYQNSQADLGFVIYICDMYHFLMKRPIVYLSKKMHVRYLKRCHLI